MTVEQADKANIIFMDENLEKLYELAMMGDMR
jgi:hypothetical protein